MPSQNPLVTNPHHHTNPRPTPAPASPSTCNSALTNTAPYLTLYPSSDTCPDNKTHPNPPNALLPNPHLVLTLPRQIASRLKDAAPHVPQRVLFPRTETHTRCVEICLFRECPCHHGGLIRKCPMEATWTRGYSKREIEHEILTPKRSSTILCICAVSPTVTSVVILRSARAHTTKWSDEERTSFEWQPI